MTAVAEKVTMTLKYAAIGALAFQGVHLLEHIVQLGHWFPHPTESPWITPWAVVGRDALAVGGQIPLGNELLHLGGNLVFLGGLIALAVYWTRVRAKVSPYLRTALWVQGVHVGEHVALTATTIIFGEAIGLSTFFGLVSGPVASSYRVWFHFFINSAATFYAAKALIALYRQGLLTRSVSGRLITADAVPHE